MPACWKFERDRGVEHRRLDFLQQVRRVKQINHDAKPLGCNKRSPHVHVHMNLHGQHNTPNAHSMIMHVF